MRIFIDGLPVVFPYKLIFSEQEIYIRYLKKTLGCPRPCHLGNADRHREDSLPSISSDRLSSRQHQVQKSKDSPIQLVYCTRTVVEMDKTLAELKNLLHFRDKETKDEKKLTCLGLTAKKNLYAQRG